MGYAEIECTCMQPGDLTNNLFAPSNASAEMFEPN